MDNIVNAPELEWLKANSVHSTPEGVNTTNKEYLRTWCSINLLNYVLEGNYKVFSSCQKEGRITLKSFNEMREWVKNSLRTPELEDAMRAFLVINDLGKIGDFVEKVKEATGFESIDHDSILYEGLKAHPEFSPTFYGLKPEFQELILDALEPNFNVAQFIQCECFPANLLPLQKMHDESFNFLMIHALFDIGGAAGHVVPDGTIIINELYWKKFSYAVNNLTALIQEYYDPFDADLYYVCDTQEFYGFHEYTVLKLCNLMRLTDSIEADKADKAFKTLDSSVKNYIVEEECHVGINNTAILMYYLPATLQNALSYYKKENPENAIGKTISTVIPVIADLFRRVRSEIKVDKGVIVAFISDVAEAAKDPESLKSSDFEIRPVGNDFVIYKKEVEK